MEIRVEFQDGSECYWQTGSHKNINIMVEALKENLDKPWKAIHISIVNRD